MKPLMAPNVTAATLSTPVLSDAYVASANRP